MHRPSPTLRAWFPARQVHWPRKQLQETGQWQFSGSFLFAWRPIPANIYTGTSKLKWYYLRQP